MNTKWLFLHALTPVHSGTGQAVAVIDLPIAREKATGYPLIPSSSLKGVLRDVLTRSQQNDWIDKAFGKMESAGAFCFGDQRLLLLPIRSYFGTFAWVTCPLVLQRLKRDGTASARPFDFLENIALENIVPKSEDDILLPSDTRLTEANGQTVFLEDLDLKAQKQNPGVEGIANGLAALLFAQNRQDKTAHKDFRERFAVISDMMFIYLCETATEVTARIALKEDTKTVRKGGLWYEEAVPAETIFCGPVLIDDRFAAEAEDLLAELPADCVVQIGGKASVGRGLCRVVVN